MRTLRRFLTLTLFALLFSTAAEAEDFIFKYREDVYAQGFAMPMSVGFEQEQLMDEFYLTDDEEALKQMLADGLIEYYGPDASVRLMEAPNDTYYGYQQDYEFRLTNANTVVNNGTYDGRGVRVGIIDTGVAPGLEDINYDRIVSGRDITVTVNPKDTPEEQAAKEEQAKDFTDMVGHGTAVAGVIAAKTDNGAGVSSLAPEVELVIVKAFAGKSNTTSVSNLIKGLDYAVKQDCDVVNMSVGAKQDNNNAAAIKSMEETIQKAAEAGVIVVAAAGNHDSTAGNKNDLTKDSPFMYPGAFDNVVSVASVDYNGSYSSFSYHNSKVNVAACGGGVRLLKYNEPDTTMVNSGTSFSTPYVTSVAALVKQIAPETDAAGFLSLLYETSTDAGDPGWDSFYGAGIVNVGRIMDRLLGGGLSLGKTKYNENDSKFTLEVTNNGYDGARLMEVWYELYEGDKYGMQLKTVVVPSQTTVTLEFDNFFFRAVEHMLWDRDTLEPLMPKETFYPTEA